MAAIPKLCCLTPYVLQGEPRGNLEDASTNPGLQLKRYHAKPSTGASKAPKTAIVLLYDVFGFSLPNAKLLADEFADRLGVDVFAPNYIPRPPHIEPFLPIAEIAPDQLANSGQSMITKVINTIWAVFKSLPYLPEVFDYFVMPRVHKALADLKADGYENLGVIGYCRGGGVAIRLLAEHAPLVKCGIICHPGPLYQSLWPSIEAPTAWHLAEKDNWVTDEHLAVLVRLAAEKQAQGQTFEQTRHLGTTHGFASRPNTGHDPSMVAFDNVKDDTVRFFKEHLGIQQ